MKTEYFIIIKIIIFIFVNSNLKAETIFFDSQNIKIEENGNMVFATNGTANIPSNNFSLH